MSYVESAAEIRQRMGQEQEQRATPELNDALSKAQGEMAAARRDSTNPHFRSNYASLAAVFDAIQEPFAKNGLSQHQKLHSRDGQVGVETEIRHSSGQQLVCPILWLPFDEQKGRTAVQAIGSAIQYGRRYSLMAAAGLPSEDDDGNAAGSTDGKKKTGKRTYPTEDPLPPKDDKGDRVTAPQLRLFHVLTKGLSKEAIQKGMDSRGFEGMGFGDLSKSEGSAIIDALKKQEEEHEHA